MKQHTFRKSPLIGHFELEGSDTALPDRDAAAYSSGANTETNIALAQRGQGNAPQATAPLA